MGQLWTNNFASRRYNYFLGNLQQLKFKKFHGYASSFFI